MVREGQNLFHTEKWIDEGSGNRVQSGRIVNLRMPEPPEVESLLTPPAAIASNDGSDAESFVAKVLRSQGWEVVFYTNRRGYGFDLWARRDNRAMVIEVKSSYQTLGTVNLTSLEYQAAVEHGDNFMLALVENMGITSPTLHIIQNPASIVNINIQRSTNYTITRSEWMRVTR